MYLALRKSLCDASTGEVLEGHTGAIKSVAFSNDSTRIASGSEDKSVRVWDASTGMELIKLKGHSSGVYSSSDDARIVSGSHDKSVQV